MAKTKLIIGLNDLQTKFPAIAAQWHPILNGELTPQDVGERSQKKVWWQGTCGHIWEAKISNRTANGTGCPYCSSKKVLLGLNDLATNFPNIAAQWHPTKNGELTPQNVASKASKKVWWLGTCGHEWEARIQARTVEGTGCPYCSNREILVGFNDLSSNFPTIAAEWHNEKNGALSPQNVASEGYMKVWWKCAQGHEWQERIRERTVNGLNCPICNYKKKKKEVKLIPGINDLQTRYPYVAAQWHPNKNESLTTSDVLAGCVKKVWWLGSCGHEWEATIRNRTVNGSGCPYCSSPHVIPGETDLATKYPEISNQWNFRKNGDLTPSDVAVASRKKVWWVCENGHEWQAQIYKRTLHKVGCPICKE